VLYLREPANLPRDAQARLVEYFDKQGAPSTTRLMAGSARNLEQACHDGTLLQSLYYRLSTLSIDLPPLRERQADLPLLVQQTLERCQAGDGQSAMTIHPAAWDLLRSYDWPGNLAELQTVLRKAQQRAQGAEIQLSDFPAQLRAALDLAQIPAPVAERELPLDELLAEAERRLINLALRQARHNKSRAGARLHITRARLYRRMQTLGIADLEGRQEAESGELQLEPSPPAPTECGADDGLPPGRSS
jgi:DNA-binding NtrC family response regulator